MAGQARYMKDFSLGVRMEEPDEPAVVTEVEGVRYYIERRDEWYFVNHDLHVNVNPNVHELTYTYEKA